MAELKVVGRRVPLVDAREKVTGAATYTVDLKLPGLLQGRVLRSSHPHARLLHVDTSRAERLPGVKAVVTAADTPLLKFGIPLKDEYIYAHEKVRYVGDEVAAVAAVDEATAKEALSLIRVEYEPLPAVFDPLEALTEGAPQLHDHVQGNVACRNEISRGDVAAAFREADLVLEERFTTSAVHPSFLEPRSCVAHFDTQGKLSLWSGTQMMHISRLLMAQALDLPESKIRMVQPCVGGAFGGRVDFKVCMLAAILARKAGRPVKLTVERYEEIEAGPPRVPMIIDLKLAFKEGLITAKEARIVADNGAYNNWAWLILVAGAHRQDALYKYQNIHIAVDLVYTNKLPTGCFRGFGNPQMTFALEQMLDMAASKLSMDPAELRLRNARQVGDPHPHGWRIQSCGLSQCIKQATWNIGWAEKRARKQPYRGLGLACAVQNSGSRILFDFAGSAAVLKMHEDGRVSLLSGEGDIGGGSLTALAQIAAEELGIPVDDVDVARPDTDVTPLAYGAFASRITHIGGNAVREAATDLRRQLFKAVADKLEARPEDLEARDRRIFVRGSPQRGLTMRQAFQAAVYRRGGSPLIGRGSFDPPTELQDPKTWYGNYSSAFPFAAHAAEVEVDPETGVVRLLSYSAATDLGRVINALAAEGQVEGGISQGLGYALTEGLVFEGGRVGNPTLADYRLPTAVDALPIDISFVETIDPVGPYGAKSLGEVTLVPTAAAIANAIADAIGVRFRELPITPEKVLRALRARDRA
jgi:CO/xanthine dehydrogenase Mo-binding subunit